MMTLGAYWTILSFCVLFRDVVTDAISSEWRRVYAFDDTLPAMGNGVPCRSLVYCADYCSRDSNCESFFYTSGEMNCCWPISTVLSQTDGLSSVIGSSYFVKEVPELPRTPTSFSCPPDDTVFRTVQLSDGNTFTYRVFKTAATQSVAKQNCIAEGGYLARVTTIEEMNILLNLTAFPGYGSSDYFIDGSNADDFPTYSSWTMSNGDQVPMAQRPNEFWHTVCPNNPLMEHCVRMRSSTNYYWDDCHCSMSYSYICEM